MRSELPPDHILILFTLFIACQAEIGAWSQQLASTRTRSTRYLSAFASTCAFLLTLAALLFWIAIMVGSDWRVELVTGVIAIVFSVFYEFVIRTALFFARNLLTFWFALLAVPIAALLGWEIWTYYFKPAEIF
ncbi:hypothetical protein [Paracoccus sp. SCSIO 75233]|uniref:hypothetical protein n=1 Tax=Paracoccus sp. SCSIO 75233 TaxID=3017782 RepID=UPI0022EFEC60|nr:hypothetical protein [Paracoccus sp. SCSIO 75233]WBU54608.1 hypothetical protein PAF12_07205 [Paracoccus sp. SCSIO 75233]